MHITLEQVVGSVLCTGLVTFLVRDWWRHPVIGQDRPAVTDSSTRALEQ
jgi:hypothetical protein